MYIYIYISPLLSINAGTETGEWSSLPPRGVLFIICPNKSETLAENAVLRTAVPSAPALALLIPYFGDSALLSELLYIVNRPSRTAPRIVSCMQHL